MNRIYVWSQRCAVIVTTGMLFQAGGCSAQSQEFIAAFVGAALQNLVATAVFGSFNLLP